MESDRSLKRQRRSGIELLRIIAMYLIVVHHMVIHNSFDFMAQPDSFRKVFLGLFEYLPGKIGIALFFIASAWFLSVGNQTLEKSCKKIWVLERELLFWSLAGLVLRLVATPMQMNIMDFVSAVFPVATQLWWYATSYVLFLLFLPFLMSGLKSLGSLRHKRLIFCMVAVWGVLYLIPGAALNIGLDLTGFIYIYVLITYHRWYMRPMKTKTVWLIFILSALLLLFWNVTLELLYVGQSWDLYGVLFLVVDREWSLPVLIFSFSMFLLFERLQLQSRVINYIATLTFGVYLITDHPFVRDLLWKKIFDFNKYYYLNYPVVRMLAIVVVVYCCAAVLELIRKSIFKYTVDMGQGKLFAFIWKKVTI
ncbi:acyltransferase family protein [Bifidobacterium platyrrhinorum]|uniref:Acyltransferase family protein n=1 Tax=Bifidobacterium platyrrhinorum TaxID=2661628 RepID=A0A6L9SQL0_9BIFI|nr:acyltransferase family protein [Bifidobacterium platyrrhinorum]NEG54847.1 acyltransferase family protein [Bifidobacterium platyrrhinorum]